jgi:hypothetical protein
MHTSQFHAHTRSHTRVHTHTHTHTFHTYNASSHMLTYSLTHSLSHSCAHTRAHTHFTHILHHTRMRARALSLSRQGVDDAASGDTGVPLCNTPECQAREDRS